MAHGLTLSPGPRNPAHSAAPARPSVAPSSSARLLSALLVIAALGVLAAALGVVVYARVASQLPDPGTLMERAITFRSTRIFDREGGLLYEVQDPNGGKRTTVALDHIAEDLVQATVATEDANFWSHGGIDPFALVRAVVYAVRERRAVSGASTIPEQLVKLTFLTPERTFTRKFKEALLAAEVSRRYSKEDILQLYLNKVFYGNHSYGVQAAARTYFDKSAADLTLAEASLLAGLSQAPAYYDPYTNPERALRRREVVLGLMVERGYATRTEADEAAAAPLELEPLRDVMRAPHFTVLVREHLEEVFGADVMEEMYRAGLDVTTTLDPALQSRAEEIVAQRVTALAPKNVGNGALVAIRPDSGEVVALVGSADWNDESISGQINMATAPRQPGSSLKPFVYIAALEKGRTNAGDPWTTETLVADVPTVFPGGYEPKNYDETEHGLVTVREALANSYNIAAVRTLDDVGVGTFIDLLGRVGITPLTPEGGQFGLGVALGSAEVPLVDSTAAFAALANHGYLERPLTILKVTDADGTAVCGPDADRPCRPADAPLRRKVVDPVHAFLIADVLSDNGARAVAFGTGSALEIGRPAAVKTGTTNDYRDNLTLGFVPGLAVGVWVGNADREPMRGVSGITGAAPIWHDFMIAALEGVPVEPFTPPQGVQKHDVCADTGTAPGPACPAVRSAWFPADRPPLPPERDLWQMIGIDRDSGLRAAPGDTGDHVEQRPFKVYPPELATWAVEHGIPQPPAEIAPPPPEDDEEEETAEATATTVITPTVVVTATVPFSPTVAPTFTPWLVLTPPTPEATPDFVTLTPEPTSPPEPTVEPTYTPESTARDRPTAATRRADAVSGWRSVRGAGPSVSASRRAAAWARRWASGSPR